MATLNHSIQKSEQLTFSPEVFLANRLAVPGSEEARKMTVTSGQRCYELFGRQLHDGSSVKMLAASLLGTAAWCSRVCFLTWKVQATKRGRLLFRLVPSTPRIGATGYGLLLTPAVVMPEEMPGQMRARALRKGYDNGTQWNSLASQVKYGFLPTPLSSDHKRSVESETQYARRNTPQRKRLAGTNNLVNAVGITNGKRNGRRLSPAFALWMMGYPPHWCDLEDGEMPRSKRPATQSSRKSPLKS